MLLLFDKAILLFVIKITHMGILLACMFMFHTCAQCLRKPEEDTGFLGTRVIGDCKLPCGFWELKLDLLAEQPMFLIIEPSSQPTSYLFLIRMEGQ